MNYFLQKIILNGKSKSKVLNLICFVCNYMVLIKQSKRNFCYQIKYISELNNYICKIRIIHEIEVNIICGLKAKDLNRFKKIFFTYHGNLVLFANKFTGDMQVSRDLVQDAFMKLWEQYQANNEIKSPKAYLFKAVRNNSLNHHRHLKTKYTFEEELVSKINLMERTAYFDKDNPLQSLLELEMKEKINSLIQTMPEKCRKVYKMSRHDFLKNKEIAKKIGISEKMVEKHISKALLILRKGLSDYLGFLFIVLVTIIL